MKNFVAPFEEPGKKPVLSPTNTTNFFLGQHVCARVSKVCPFFVCLLLPVSCLALHLVRSSTSVCVYISCERLYICMFLIVPTLQCVQAAVIAKAKRTDEVDALEAFAIAEDVAAVTEAKGVVAAIQAKREVSQRSNYLSDI